MKAEIKQETKQASKMKTEIFKNLYNKFTKSVEDIYNAIISVIIDMPYNPLRYFAIIIAGLATLDLALIGSLGFVSHTIAQIGSLFSIFKNLEPRHIFFLVILIFFFFAFKDKQK